MTTIKLIYNDIDTEINYETVEVNLTETLRHMEQFLKAIYPTMEGEKLIHEQDIEICKSKDFANKDLKIGLTDE